MTQRVAADAGGASAVTEEPPFMRRDPSPRDEIAAGFFSGVCDAIASHPLDQVKTQMQINPGKNGTVLSSLQKQVARGGVLQLYRGVLAACLRPQSLCMFTGNEWSKRACAGPGGQALGLAVPDATGELSTRGGFVAGSLTGFFESACVTPFELVKVRMQSFDHMGRYASSIHCLADIVKTEGVLVLYNGFFASCWRNCTFNGTFFGLLHWAKKDAPLPKPQTQVGVATLDISLGMAASFVATCVKMPFDIAKNRLQNQRMGGPGEVPRYRHTLQVCGLVWREEGALALFKGFSPTVMRIVLGQSVAYAAFEFAIEKLNPTPAESSKLALSAAA